MSGLFLVASGDDFLLEGAVADVVRRECAAVGLDEPELLSEEMGPGEVAVEVCSPSLFASDRVLFVADVRAWIGAKRSRRADGKCAAADPAPLIEALSDGIPEGVTLVMGLCCRERPKGPLVESVEQHGELVWIPVPAPPKPWEDVALSSDQAAMLAKVLRRAAGDVRFDRAAENLLLERLGFAPRLLVQEATKLAAAAGPSGLVDEDLVRQLVFPKERSTEVVGEAIELRRLGPLVDLVAAAARGVPVHGMRGERLGSKQLAIIIFSLVANLLEQMLYLRRLAHAAGLVAELDPQRTAASQWYPRTFKSRLGPELQRRIGEDPHSPFSRAGRAVSVWRLGKVFAACGRYSEDVLMGALAQVGDVEAQVRGPLPLAAIPAWLAQLRS